jgi:hypothetical protein
MQFRQKCGAIGKTIRDGIRLGQGVEPRQFLHADNAQPPQPGGVTNLAGEHNGPGPQANSLPLFPGPHQCYQMLFQ